MAISSIHNGWYWNKADSRLEMYYRGTMVGHIDATDLYAIALTVTGASTLGATTAVSVDTQTLTVTGVSTLTGAVTAASTLGVAGKITYYDQLVHGNATLVNITNEGQSRGVGVTDAGKIFQTTYKNTIFTLPATSAGLMYSFVNQGTDATVDLAIQSFSDDKIMGPDSTGADKGQWFNTGATHKAGDFATVASDGGSDGWYVVAQGGTWAAVTISGSA